MNISPFFFVRRAAATLSGRIAAALTASLLLMGGVASAQTGAASGKVDFPAAVGIAPTAKPVGPEQIVPVPAATGGIANPEDVVFLDAVKKQIVLINGGYNGTTLGGETVVASSAVGSGVAFATGNGVYQGCVSPGKILYYFDGSLGAFIALDLNTTSYTRTRTTVSTSTAQIPGSANLFANTVCWDFSTGTIIYFDTGPNGTNTSTITRGIYRYNPTTGTNTLLAPQPGQTGNNVNAITIDQNGTIYGIINSFQNSLSEQQSSVVRINSDGSYTTLDGATATYGTTATNPRYYETVTLDWDFYNNRILVFDEGDDQPTSRIIAVNPTSSARTFVSNGSAGASATKDANNFINLPGFGYVQTNNRLIYSDSNAAVTYSIFAAISSGSPNATAITSTTATNLGTAPNYNGTFVPPGLPTLTTPTATTGANGTTATLGANVTSSGAALVAPAIKARGVVYAATATNANPQIGGAGVTQVAASSNTTGTYTVAVSGLTAGTMYSYAGYATTVWGTSYSPVATFTEPVAPSVTTNAATGITGTSAVLNGNVTADGGSTLTARGFVYSSTNTAPVLGNGTTLTDASATTGAFADTASGLTNGTTYYFRAYATNAVNTTYGSVLNFKTFAPPTANSQSVNVPFNTATAITLTGSDPNTPAQSLTYNITTQPTHGTLSGTAPNLTYTPTTGYHGADSFQFTTTNASGLTSSAATVSITVATGTPTANSQSVSVGFNTATAITLTASDPDSPALTLTYTVVTAPTHGTLSGTAPNLTYTPTANYQGADSFTFRVSNGTNTSNTATVSITVGAGTPTANSQSVNTNFNTAVGITLTGTDPDSPALALTYTVATAPSHGTLSGTAPNLTYTPTANYQGADSFTFTVSNGQKTSAPATVSLTVIGQPTISSFTPTSGPVGTLVTITGTNLQNAIGINFLRNVAGTNFTIVSSTQVTVRVPAGASTGTLTVLSGSGNNSSLTKFTVTP